MKEHTSIFLLFFSLSISVHAQQNDTIFYDKGWNETNANNCKFYRLYVNIEDVIKVTDYYKNGKIQMTGGYKSLDFKEPTGPFFYYNRKSKLTGLELYEPHLYPIIQAKLNTSGVKIPEIEDLSAILFVTYDKNDKIRVIGYGFDKCTAHGTWLYFNKKGNLIFKYNYFLNEKDGECVCYSFYGTPMIIGNYKNVKKVGAWEYRSPDGNVYKTINYIDGKKEEIIR